MNQKDKLIYGVFYDGLLIAVFHCSADARFFGKHLEDNSNGKITYKEVEK